MSTTEIILFDVGGVLVELGPSPLPPGFEAPFARYAESNAAIAFAAITYVMSVRSFTSSG